MDQGLDGRIGDRVINDPVVYWNQFIANIFNMMSWLWFLVALFIVVVVTYPFMLWTQRRREIEDLSGQDLWAFLG